MTQKQTISSKKSILTLSLFVGAALVVLLMLGTWQLQRLAWKNALIADMERQMAADPVPLPVALEDPASWEFRKVTMTGHFIHADERHIYRPGPQGGAGYHIFTPFERSDNTMIFVNRGWIAEELKDPVRRLAGQLTGEIELTGVVRQKEIPAALSSGYFGDVEKNIFYLAWPKELAATLGRSGPDYYVATDSTPVAGGWPIGGVTRVDLPNNHLQYALTWYGLAVGLLGIYVALIRRQSGLKE